MLKFLFRLITMVVVLGLIGFIGFAFVGDLSPERAQTETPVTIVLD